MPADGESRIGPRDLTRWDTPVGRRVARLVVPLAARMQPHRALLLALLIGALAAALMATGVHELYEAITGSEGVARLDRPTLDWAVAHRSPAEATWVSRFTEVGGPVGMPILATVVTAALAITWRTWRPVVLMAVAAGGSLLMTVVGKAWVARSRPPLLDAVPPYETSWSFPSGHSLNALVVAGVVCYLLLTHEHRRRTRTLTVVLASVFAAAMGLSRVYLGHHWLTDVLAAWVLGAGWLVLVITGHRLWLTTRQRPDPAEAGDAPPDGSRTGAS